MTTSIPANQALGSPQMTPEARRREIARILAAAVVRFRTRPAPLPTLTEKLSENSPTRLESPSGSATHVIVREDVSERKETGE